MGWVLFTAGPPGPDAGSELAGIDHVALSQPLDYFDEAALFYRSVRQRALHYEDLVSRNGLEPPWRARRTHR